MEEWQGRQRLKVPDMPPASGDGQDHSLDDEHEIGCQRLMDPHDVFSPRPDAADRPVEGYYAVDRRGKVGLPVRIWFGPPIDEDGAYDSRARAGAGR
jgi:hypothetical protein